MVWVKHLQLHFWTVVLFYITPPPCLFLSPQVPNLCQLAQSWRDAKPGLILPWQGHLRQCLQPEKGSFNWKKHLNPKSQIITSLKKPRALQSVNAIQIHLSPWAVAWPKGAWPFDFNRLLSSEESLRWKQLWIHLNQLKRNLRNQNSWDWSQGFGDWTYPLTVVEGDCFCNHTFKSFVKKSCVWV